MDTSVIQIVKTIDIGTNPS